MEEGGEREEQLCEKSMKIRSRKLKVVFYRG